jgi:anti-anti-sigma factor
MTTRATRGYALPTEVAVSVLHRPANTVVALRGDIDIATAPALRERLFGLLRPGMRLLILDLSGVPFCGAAGLAVLIGTRRRAISLGITVHLSALRPQTAKVMRITGLDRSFTIHPAHPGRRHAVSRAEPAHGSRERAVAGCSTQRPGLHWSRSTRCC